MFFAIIMVFVSTVFVTIFFSKLAIGKLEEHVRTNNMNMAIGISESRTIGDLIGNGDPSGEIQKYTSHILKGLKDIDMIVIADMDGIRFAHPNEDRLGQHFVGGDETRVIKTGESYTTTETGTLGTSIRAFVPILDSDDRQVGFIMVGTLLEGVIEIKEQILKTIIAYSLGGIFLGSIGAGLLAYNIKKSILGLEPYEIGHLYKEKQGILQAIEEGIISINEEGLITTINDSARRILGIDSQDLIGEKIANIIPGNYIEDILLTGELIIDRETRLNNINVVTNIVPIRLKGKIVGAISTFRDKSEVTRLAKEITGYNEMVKSLRANSHDFLNKSHVILGLLEIGDINMAKRYILHMKDHQQKTISQVIDKIKDPIIGGLILGKISRARELGVIFNLSDDSILYNVDMNQINLALVTILGNIIENAFESTIDKDIGKKSAGLRIIEDEKGINIELEDNGVGIKEEDLSLIMQKGRSTKGKDRGLGLFLVKEKLDTIGGKLNISSEYGLGTRVNIFIPKEVRDD